MTPVHSLALSVQATLSGVDPQTLLFIVATAAVLLPHVPAGRYLIYPLSFLATWAHEMGHVVATILVGGTVKSVHLRSNLAGTVLSRRPSTLASAFLSPVMGLLGPSVAGGLVIALGPTTGRPQQMLFVMGTLLIVTAVIWVRNAVGLLFSAVLGGLLLWVSFVTGTLTAFWCTQAIGMRLAVESLLDFGYLFSKQAGDTPSDTQLLARAFWLPYWIWGSLIGTLSLTILWCSLYWTWGHVLPAGFSPPV